MSSNTSNDEEQYEQKWQCDLCKTALFDTYDEALEHEKNCGVINIRYEEGKELGLTLVCNRKNDNPSVSISPVSIIFTLANYINASVAKTLLCLSTWDDMDDSCIRNLRDFGRKNIPLIQKSYSVETFNGDCLKAVLTGKITPELTIKKVKYSKNNLVCLVDNPSLREIIKIVKCRDSYPIQLKLFSTTSGARTKQSSRVRSKLDLSNSILVQSIDWNRLSEGLYKLDHVTEIDLSNNNIGWGGCIALASLLKRDSSSLTKLCLRWSKINDDCVTPLVNGLRNNTTLITLDLSHNGGYHGITRTGWIRLLHLLCDATSINHTYHSNHTLQELGDLTWIHKNTCQWPLSWVIEYLHEYLDVNKKKGRSHKNAARYKIWNRHFFERPGVFDLSPLLDMDVQVIPHVLAWIANDFDERELLCRTAIYQFIGNWDVPVLFGYPSAESIRIGKRIEDLEKLVESLITENEKLKEEIQVVKGCTCSNITDGPESLKRRRNT